MENHYFFTLLSLTLVCILTAALGLWQHIPVIDSAVQFTLCLAVLFWLVLYGFTHAVKANKDAKFFSYLCGALSLMTTSIIVMSALMASAELSHVFMICVAFNIIAAILLVFTTRKKTRSYF